MTIQTTKSERELLHHALGERKTSRGRKAKSLKDCYRNHFCADPDSEDDLVWRGMVDKGLARLASGPRPEIMPYNTYAVTELGFGELG